MQRIHKMVSVFLAGVIFALGVGIQAQAAPSGITVTMNAVSPTESGMTAWGCDGTKPTVGSIGGKNAWGMSAGVCTAVGLVVKLNNGVLSTDDVPQNVELVVEYYDGSAGSGSFKITYDSLDATNAVVRKDTSSVALTGTNQWVQHTFELTNARVKRSVSGVDFKIDSTGSSGTVWISQAWANIQQAQQPDSPPDTVPAGAVGAVLDSAAPTYNGLKVWAGDSGSTTLQAYLNKKGWETTTTTQYIYADVDDSYIYGGKNAVDITVDYFDNSINTFDIAYNSSLTSPAYAYTEKVQLTNTGTWQTHVFHITDAKFANEKNGGSDFRLEATLPVCFASVIVNKIGVVGIRGESDNTGNIFLSGQQAELRLNLTNSLAAQANLTVQYKVLDYAGAKVGNDNSFQVSVPAGGSSVQTLNLGALPKGTYTLTVSAPYTDGQGNAQSVQAGVPFSVIADLQGKTADGTFGVSAHFSQGKGNSATQASLIPQAGATWVRDGCVWSAIETKKGTYTFPAAYDQNINNLLAQNLKPFLVLSGSNSLYQDGDPNIPDTDAEIAAYASYCAAVAQHYKGKVQAYEIWNEWNSKYSAADYFKILKAAYTAIKAVDPTITVIGGAAVGYDGVWLKKIVDLGACSYMDAISFHPYCYPANPENGGIIADFEDIDSYVKANVQANNIKGADGKPKDIQVWCTETGWPNQVPSRGGIAEILSAAYGAQLYAQAMAHPGLVDEWTWYDLQNDALDPQDGECNFGLLTTEAGGAAKAPFVSLNAFADLLTNATFLRTYNELSPDIRIYQFQREDGKTAYMIWSNAADHPLKLSLGTTQFTVYDIFGNPQDILSDDGTLDLNVTSAPTYIVGNFTSAPSISASDFSVGTTSVKAVQGETASIEIDRAGSAQNLAGTYVAQLPDGWLLTGSASFSAGNGRDAVHVAVPSSAAEGTYTLTFLAESESGQIYSTVSAQVQVLKPFLEEVYTAPAADGQGYDLAVKITNQSGQTALSAGSVAVTSPTDMQATQTFSEIAPNASVELRFPFPTVTSTTLTPVSVVLTRQGGYTSAISRSLSALTADKADGVTADGHITEQEWGDTPQFVLNNEVSSFHATNTTVPMTSDADLSANGYLRWDSDYLYLAAKVTDDVQAQPYDAANMWKADSIQFAIDPGRARGPGSLGYDEIGVALNSLTGEVMETLSSTIPGVTGSKLANSKFSVTRNEDTHTTEYEVALKWSDILPAGMSVGSGDDIGFSFLVNESDDGSVRRGWFEYMKGIGSSKDQTLYGDLILTGEDASQPPDGNTLPQDALSLGGVPATVAYGDEPFTLSVSGGSGTGALSYSVLGSAVSVDANGKVSIQDVGTATVTVTKAGDDTYDPASASVTITVEKGQSRILTLPTASGVTTPAVLSSAVLTGGAGSVPGTFAWLQPDAAVSGSGGYTVTFVPSDTDHYLPCTGTVPVTVTASRLSDSGTGVQVLLSQSVLPNGILLQDVRLAVNAVTSGAVYTSVQNALADVGKRFALFDISLSVGQTAVEPTDGVQVSLPIPDGFNPDHLALYYIKDDGSTEQVTGGSVQDGMYVFTARHFSSYALVDTSGTDTSAESPASTASPVSSEPVVSSETSSSSTDSTANPQTGVETSAGAAVAVFAAAACAALLFGRRRKNGRNG